jgi:RNA polymerase-binding transcription factor DksA
MNLANVKTRLLAARAELEARLARTHKHLYQRDEPVSPNFNEQIKETENDQLVQALDSEGQAELRQIDIALARLAAGEYLNCRLCGDAIGEERLKAIPQTDLCIACASAV